MLFFLKFVAFREALFGIKGADFVLLATDTRSIRSIVVMKGEEEKFRELNSSALLAYSGEAGDTVNFAEFIQRNVQLYGVRNDKELGVSEAANWTRRTLADSLRSRHPYQVNVLIGGVERDYLSAKPESNVTPKLYWIDYLSAMAELPYAVHGYASYFCTSLLDRYWREGMSQDEVLGLLKMCLQELKVRFIVSFPKLAIRIIRSDGVQVINFEDLLNV